MSEGTRTPPGTRAEVAAARRARIAPLLAAGKGVREIARKTGIPVGAVHRAKRRIEKASGASHVTKRTINGVSHEIRHLTFDVYERKVAAATGRGFLDSGKRDDGAMASALFAACFTDGTLHWLHRHGYLDWGDRGRVEAIIAGVNELIARQSR